MASMNIDDAERVTEVSGSEVVPVSKGGAPKAMTAEQIKEYVMTALSQSVDAEINFDTDRIVVSRKTPSSNHVVRVDAIDIAESVIDILYGRRVGKDDIDENWSVVVGNSDAKKSVTLGDLSEWVKELIVPRSIPVDIVGMDDASGLGSSDLVPLFSSTDGKNVKATLRNVSVRVASEVLDSSTEKSSVANDDRIVVFDGSGVASKVRASAIVATGKVNKPTVVESVTGRIATFGNSDGSSLDATLKKVDSITEASTTSDIPSAPAVKAYVSGSLGSAGNVTSSEVSSADGDIVVFSDSDGKHVRNGGVKISNEVGEEYSDGKVLTEKAIAEYVDEKVGDVESALSSKGDVKCSSVSISTTRALVKFADTTGKNIEQGPAVTDVIEGYFPARVPLESAVKRYVDDAVSGLAKSSSVATPGGVVTMGADRKTLNTNHSIVTSIRGVEATDNCIPTEKAVSEKVSKAVEMQSAVSASGMIVVTGDVGTRTVVGKFGVSDGYTSSPSGDISATKLSTSLFVDNYFKEKVSSDNEGIASRRICLEGVTGSNKVVSVADVAITESVTGGSGARKFVPTAEAVRSFVESNKAKAYSLRAIEEGDPIPTEIGSGTVYVSREWDDTEGRYHAFIHLRFGNDWFTFKSIDGVL